MRARRSSVVALAVAIVGLAAWRAACIVAGPEVDTDAYAHHMIARAILADPYDLSVHWVWLPLFHYLQVPLVALGGTIQDVRWANVVVAATLPLVLFGYVRSTARSGPAWSADATALVAALVAATSPIAMQMGTTAQPEPLFALLVLGVAIAFQRRRYGATAALLAGAVLLRYEAWASLATIATIIVVEPLWRRHRRLGGEQGASGAWMVVAAPVTLILAWAALRRPVDGQWFGFLRDTHEFAAGVMRDKGSTSHGLAALMHDISYYPLLVPLRVMGPALPLAMFGVVRTVRQQGARFVLVVVSCLAFVSLTWVMRSTLGLDRHFVVVVPLYATFAAQGAAAIADSVARFAQRATTPRKAALVGRAGAAALSIASLGGLFVALHVWMGFWRGSIERGWPERASLGAYLRLLPGATTIFCDEATVEILSGVDRRRFDRHWINDPHTWDRISEVARARGVAYVATWREKLRGHEAAGDILFSAGEVGADPDSGIAVMRVPPSVSQATR